MGFRLPRRPCFFVPQNAPVNVSRVSCGLQFSQLHSPKATTSATSCSVLTSRRTALPSAYRFASFRTFNTEGQNLTERAACIALSPRANEARKHPSDGARYTMMRSLRLTRSDQPPLFEDEPHSAPSVPHAR